MKKHNLLAVEVYYSEKDDAIGATYSASSMMEDLIKDADANDIVKEAISEMDKILEGMIDKIDEKLEKMESEGK